MSKLCETVTVTLLGYPGDMRWPEEVSYWPPHPMFQTSRKPGMTWPFMCTISCMKVPARNSSTPAPTKASACASTGPVAVRYTSAST